MLVADGYLGHRSDAAAADRLADAGADSHRVVLSDTERRRSRVRTETAGGRDLGIVCARDLRDGDVLEAEDGTPVVVELASVDALVLDFADADVAPTAALELGHALGNRHWDLAVRGEEALVAVADSRSRTAAVVEERLPAAVTYGFEAVPPRRFDGGTSSPGHGHEHDRADGSARERAGRHSHAGARTAEERDVE